MSDLKQTNVWTENPPTVPGWYWVNVPSFGRTRKTRPIRILRDESARYVIDRLKVNCNEFGVYPLRETLGREWLWGPKIDEPKDPSGV